MSNTTFFSWGYRTLYKMSLESGSFLKALDILCLSITKGVQARKLQEDFYRLNS